MEHELKTWVNYFQDIKSGSKTFELRKNDRNFEIGDELILKEYDNENSIYTGDKIYVKVIYILYGGVFGLEEGYVIMGIDQF